MFRQKVDNIEEEQASLLEQTKVDEVEEYNSSVPSKKKEMDKYDASITSTKNGTDDIVEKSREMWLRNTKHLLSPQK